MKLFVLDASAVPAMDRTPQECAAHAHAIHAHRALSQRRLIVRA
jgi:hypothetical protein